MKRKKKNVEIYEELLKTFRFTEFFDDMITCEDTAELFFNLSRHFLEFSSACAWLTSDKSLLAAREMDSDSIDKVKNLISEEWLEYFKVEFRPIMIPYSSVTKKDDDALLAVPFFFGWKMIGYAVLLLSNSSTMNDAKFKIIEILSRSAGVAMGRIAQSAQIEAEKAHTRNLFASIVSPLIIVDENGVIEDANGSAEKDFGKNIRGKHYIELFGFIRNDPIKLCLESGEPAHRVEVFGKQNKLWGVTVSPHLMENRKKGAVIGFRDLTELKQIEEKLAAAERQAIIGRLSSAVAHEVNNPLGAMKAHLKLLMKKYNDDANTVSELKIISEQTDRIARTVKLLLNFSRQRNAPKNTFNPAEIIKTVAALFEESLREKKISLNLNIYGPLPFIEANTDQFQEILINIIENARDALDENSVIDLSASSDGYMLTIVIEDNGPGLGENPDILFEPFFTTKANGTGLGLTIARRICESLGGSMTGENKMNDGKGARFTIKLPVKHDEDIKSTIKR